MQTLRFSAFLVLLVSSLVSIPAKASVNGSVSGVVKDSTGALVPQAEVKITNVDTNVAATVHTNSEGVYSFLSLPVGHYRLEVKAAGFQAYVVSDIAVNTNDELRFDIPLTVGAVTESVDVKADAVRVETANTQLGEVIGGKTMTALPLNGRNYTDLLGLQAGVVPGISNTYGNYFGSTAAERSQLHGSTWIAGGCRTGHFEHLRQLFWKYSAGKRLHQWTTRDGQWILGERQRCQQCGEQRGNGGSKP
jgi:hypothetical protein